MTALPATGPAVPGPALAPARTDPVTLDALEVAAGGGGVLLGPDPTGEPVHLDLFRPEPVSVVLVAPVALALVLALRSLAVGAEVVVETSRPAGWAAASSLATSRAGAFVVAERAGAQPAGTLVTPRLLVVDGESASADAHRVGAWSAQVTVAETAGSWNTAGLGSSDVTVVQGLPLAQAAVVGRALGLADGEAVLAGRGDDVVTLVGRGEVRHVQVRPTSVERWLLGSAAERR
ncbi:hypothetical protein SAMN03159343_1651 [Klenkia marina]|uniref:Uncharacterized protein n=1 Tax=Klenkia marina TaxID=1960309 RepID=A0A1G4XWW9_9ACTN|nr:hypothetical protein [Klenkia marina]SCX45707.1 hypothetical protein SAMN03159343_1651 [Klenkia marina]